MRDAEGMTRTWNDFIETNLGITCGQPACVDAVGLIQHAGTIITKHKVGFEGLTAYRRLKGKAPSVKMLSLGDKVLCMKPKDTSRRQNKFESKHFNGIFAGIVPRSSETVVRTDDGAALSEQSIDCLKTNHGTITLLCVKSARGAVAG